MAVARDQATQAVSAASRQRGLRVANQSVRASFLRAVAAAEGEDLSVGKHGPALTPLYAAVLASLSSDLVAQDITGRLAAPFVQTVGEAVQTPSEMELFAEVLLRLTGGELSQLLINDHQRASVPRTGFTADGVELELVGALVRELESEAGQPLWAARDGCRSAAADSVMAEMVDDLVPTGEVRELRVVNPLGAQ